MVVVVLLIFAAFFITLVVLTSSHQGLLRASVRRPRLFRVALLGAAAGTVPIDLYTGWYGAVGPGGPSLQDAAGGLLLLNVAAACAVAALHESLRGHAVTAESATTGSPASPVEALSVGAAYRPAPGPGAPGPGTQSGATQSTTARLRPVPAPPVADWPENSEPALRMGVLGWVGPVMAFAVVTAVVAAGSIGDAPELSGVGPVWACYSLLICVISAAALLRRRVREAIDPQEG